MSCFVWKIERFVFTQKAYEREANIAKDILRIKNCESKKIDDVQFKLGRLEKHYGIELWDYILNRKFTVAKELLRFSIKPVEEIVTESGIRNTDLFYQLFKENENMSPEEYRKKWAQWIK